MAQAEMPVAVFDATNPFLKSKYASLGVVIPASRSILAKHKLRLMQFPIRGQTSAWLQAPSVRRVLDTLVFTTGGHDVLSLAPPSIHLRLTVCNGLFHYVHGIRHRWFSHHLESALRILPGSVLPGARQTGEITLARVLNAKMVAMEVKSSSQVSPSDASGIQAFKRILRKRQNLVRGVALHGGKARPLVKDVLALPWGWRVRD